MSICEGENMEKKIQKKSIIKYILMVLLVIIIIWCTVVFFQGYGLYRAAISETPLADMVASILEKEGYTPLEEISPYFISGLLAVEDNRFYSHGALDMRSLSRAVYTNILNFELLEGGSTISQQLAKNMYFSFKKEFPRKVAEALVAFDLEKNYAKDDILAMYINEIYFGGGYYGIYQASYGYYQVSPAELDFDQATLLAGLPQAPSAYDPNENPEKALLRQEQVVDAMVKYEYIDSEVALKWQKARQ